MARFFGHWLVSSLARCGCTDTSWLSYSVLARAFPPPSTFYWPYSSRTCEMYLTNVRNKAAVLWGQSHTGSAALISLHLVALLQNFCDQTQRPLSERSPKLKMLCLRRLDGRRGTIEEERLSQSAHSCRRRLGRGRCNEMRLLSAVWSHWWE